MYAVPLVPGFRLAAWRRSRQVGSPRPLLADLVADLARPFPLKIPHRP